MRIVVYGDPAPQGSKRALRNPATGRVVTVEQSPKLVPWRQDVKFATEAVLEDLGRPQPFDGCVIVRMVFSFIRPRTHYRTGRNSHLLKDGVPQQPKGPPDLSKLLRSTEDALTAARAWTDDARVVEYTRAAKVYCGEDLEALDRPGVVIIIGELIDLEQLTGSPGGRANGAGTT